MKIKVDRGGLPVELDHVVGKFSSNMILQPYRDPDGFSMGVIANLKLPLSVDENIQEVMQQDLSGDYSKRVRCVSLVFGYNLDGGPDRLSVRVMMSVEQARELLRALTGAIVTVSPEDIEPVGKDFMNAVTEAMEIRDTAAEEELAP